LPAQIEAFESLQPAARPPRNTPLAAILLTNADLDHVLGLLALREGETLSIYATETVRRTLARTLGLDKVLQAFCGAVWQKPPTDDFFSLAPPKGSLRCRAIPLPGKPPRFERSKSARRQTPASGHSVAYQFFDQRTGGRLLVAPDVAAIGGELQAALEQSQAVLFDGTFWSSDELSAVKPGAAKADEMGHVTIKDVSLKVLAKLPARHKVYIHINNTNPILACHSPERSAVEAAGIVVGYDGMSFEV
jgi:pyrroloquinoline quinone biosynthesis protein B